MSMFVAEMVVSEFTLEEDVGFLLVICKQAEGVLQQIESKCAARNEGHDGGEFTTLICLVSCSAEFVGTVLPPL